MPTTEMAIDARKAEQGAARYNRAIDGMARRSRSANGQFVRSQKRINGVGAAAQSAGMMLRRMFVGVGVAAAVREIVRTIGEFEQTMVTVGSVSGATTEELDRLTDAARRLGQTTQFSASQAGEGLLFLSRAGFTTRESLAAIDDVLNLAIAGQIGLGEAADFASNILAQFGLEADETSRVVDALIASSNRANTDVRQMAEAMKFAGPIAGSLGITLEETAAAVGVLGDAGIQGSMAGTNLRMIMLSLLGPTGDARDAIERMGLTLEDVDPTANTLTEIFGKFADAGLTAADAVEIFSTRNAGAALIMADAADHMGALNEEIERAGGEAARQADAQMDTLMGSLKSLKSAVEDLMLSSGDAGLLGFFRGVVDIATGVIRAIGGMDDAFRTLAEGARRLADSTAMLFPKLSGFAKGLEGFSLMGADAAGEFSQTNERPAETPGESESEKQIKAAANLQLARLEIEEAVNKEAERRSELLAKEQAAAKEVAAARERLLSISQSAAFDRSLIGATGEERALQRTLQQVAEQATRAGATPEEIQSLIGAYEGYIRETQRMRDEVEAQREFQSMIDDVQQDMMRSTLDANERAIQAQLTEAEQILERAGFSDRIARDMLGQLEGELRRAQAVQEEADRQREQERALESFRTADTRAQSVTLSGSYQGIGETFAANRQPIDRVADNTHRMADGVDDAVDLLGQLVQKGEGGRAMANLTL